MSDAPERVRRDWRIPDALWERIQPLLPPRKPHPRGCHRPRVDDRRAMEALFFVRRTGGQGNAVPATGICSRRAAHRRFQAWTAAGVWLALWEQGLRAYDALQGIDWEWLARDGAMTKAPRGGETGGPEPDRARAHRPPAEPPPRRRRRARWPRRGGRESPCLQEGAADHRAYPGGAAGADDSASPGDVSGQRR